MTSREESLPEFVNAQKRRTGFSRMWHATGYSMAGLRAEWAKLDAPRRLQILAERHLKLKPIETRQFDSLKNLPERPPSLVPPGTSDPIGAMIEIIDPDAVTGSLPLQEAPQ